MKIHKPLFRLFYAFGLAVLLLLTLWGFVSTAQAQSSAPLDPAGYLDFSYQVAPGAPSAVTEPTAEKPESKLWWNDGFWWGSLYNSAAGAFHIYRLNWGTQTWEDTGVAIDDREDTTSDALWDDTNNKLYIASHIHQSNSSHASPVEDRGRLYRYSYNEATQTYSLDAGFYVRVNEDRTETLVLDKDSLGRLWVTYVSRDTTQSDYQVFVNATTTPGDDLTWGTPFTLPFSSVHVAQDDISSLIAFSDTEGYKIGVMWSNGISNTFHFASRLDSVSDVQSGWVETTLTLPTSANDHISLRAMETSGRLFAAVKTNAVTSTEPLVGLLARDTDGTFSFITYSIAADGDTRPIVMIDEGDLATPSDDQVHVFVTGVEGGSQICYKSAAITTPLSGMSFLPAGNCGTQFISDNAFDLIDNATSAKHNVNLTTGLAVLASDEVNGRFYVHNVLGNPPPVVTLRSPLSGATDVPVNTVIAVTFSKPMSSTTLTSSNFTVTTSSGAISGTIAYDSGAQTATFTPGARLTADATYTVTLTSGVKDAGGQSLFGAPEVWTFTTEAPTVRFSSASYSVIEDVGSATITTTLNIPSRVTVTVNYASSDGTALAGNDYLTATGTLTFTPGQTSQTITVTILGDALDELDETVNLTLGNPDPAVLGEPSSAVLTIVDDDPTPTVQFSDNAFSVDEGAGAATITATLSGGSELTVTVNYTATNITALAGSDYVTTTGTLTFTQGVITQTFTVPILPDALDEPDETVDLRLGNPDQASLGSPVEAVLTILDDDPTPTIQFSPNVYSVNESGSATITVTLSAPSGQSVAVDYATVDGTATGGVDYTSIPTTTLTFNPEVITQTFSVVIKTDALDEADETINLTLENPDDATLGLLATATVTIVDNDPAPTVQFSGASYSVNEGAGAATITATLSAASGQTVTVNYTTTDGTALAGSDYVTATGTLTFTQGVITQTFTVSILNDAQDEADETVDLTLSSPNNATPGSTTSATLTIVDNDGLPDVEFSSSGYSADESASTATITVTLSPTSGLTVTVNYTTTDGTAAAGSDYTTGSGVLTFAPGETTQTFTVAILEDTLDEADETVNLALGNPDQANLGTLDSATLAITDNDAAPTVQFSVASYSVDESASTATITVTLSPTLGVTATVNYTTTDGTAAAGSDYTTDSGVLTFAPGETTQTFTVAILEDTLDEAGETVNLTLGNPDQANLGTLASATLTITDNDGQPTVQFSSSAYSVDEGAGAATVTATLSAASGLTVTVNYTTSNGTALAGSDYMTATGTLTFTPDVITQTFTVSILNDTRDEPNETVGLTLGNPAQADLGVLSSATLTITDNDDPPTVQFSSSTYSVDEGAGTATITATLSAASGLTVTVNYTTSNGTALAGSDYMTATGTLTFTPDVITQTFTVTITNDSAGEADETVNLALSSPSNATLGAPASATLTITDNEVKIYLPIIMRIG